MADVELGMVLGEVIGLIVITDGVSQEASRIVAAVCLDERVGDAVPRHIGVLNSTKSEHIDLRAGVVPTKVGLVTIKIAFRPLDISIGVDFREASAEIPRALGCPKESRLTESAVHAAGEIQARYKRQRIHMRGQHREVDTCTESTASVGAGSDSTLDSDRLGSGCDIRDIHPEDGLGFSVVDGNTVDSDIDSRLVGATNVEIGVANSQTIVTGRDECRRGREEDRQVLPHVSSREFLCFQLDRVGSEDGYRSDDLHFVQLEILCFD